jgi:hypothetical protein
VRPYLEVSDRLGWVVLQADTIPALDAAAEDVARTVTFDVSPAGDADAVPGGESLVT